MRRLLDSGVGRGVGLLDQQDMDKQDMDMVLNWFDKDGFSLSINSMH